MAQRPAQTGAQNHDYIGHRFFSPLAIIQGTDERAKGEVQIKDLRLGAELATGIESREDYTGARLAQFSVPEEKLVEAVKHALHRR
jgi:histidyl-tRNA synthetase